MPKIWYGLSRGSEQEITTTPAPEPRIADAIWRRPGGGWYVEANLLWMSARGMNYRGKPLTYPFRTSISTIEPLAILEYFLRSFEVLESNKVHEL